MKKFVNDPQQFVPDMLKGLALANPDTLKYVPEYNLIMRADAPQDDKVSIIQGSGSGHEPAHVMVVGKGMLDGACPGDVFAAPPMDYVYESTKLLNSAKGVLLLVNNYTGDRMAFDMAQEMSAADGINVRTLFIDDDVAVQDSTWTVGRRGVAGNFFVIKAVGAAAEAGADLDELMRIGEKVNSRDPDDGAGPHRLHASGQGIAALRARRRRDRDRRRHPRRARAPPRQDRPVRRARRHPARAGRRGPAVRERRSGRADDQRPRRNADQRALRRIRPRPRGAREAGHHGRRAATSASTARRSTWPAHPRPSSSSTTRSRACSRRPPRRECGSSSRPRRR